MNQSTLRLMKNAGVLPVEEGPTKRDPQTTIAKNFSDCGMFCGSCRFGRARFRQLASA